MAKFTLVKLCNKILKCDGTIIVLGLEMDRLIICITA